MFDPAEQRCIEILRKASRPLTPKKTGLEARPAKKLNVRAVLFDVYGTLFISGSGDIGISSDINGKTAMEESLRASGASLKEPDAGTTGFELLQTLIREDHEKIRLEGVDYPEVDIREIWKRLTAALVAKGLITFPRTDGIYHILAAEYESRVNPVWPMPGLSETLQRIRSLSLPIGIVSNAQFYTPLLFPALLGSHLPVFGFDSRICIWSYRERRAKPSPLLFEKTCAVLEELYGIPPGATLYIGNDMRNDIWAAASAGMKTALFAGDSRSLRLRRDDHCCKNLDADVILTELDQLFLLL